MPSRRRRVRVRAAFCATPPASPSVHPSSAEEVVPAPSSSSCDLRTGWVGRGSALGTTRGRIASHYTGSRVGGGSSTMPREHGQVSGRTEHLRYPRCHPQRRSGSDDEHHDPPDRRARQPPNRLEHAQLLDLLRSHLRHLPRAVFGLSRRRRRRRRDARGGEARAGSRAHRAGQRATRGRQGHRS